MTDLLHFTPFILANIALLVAINAQRKEAEKLRKFYNFRFRKQGCLPVL